MKPSIDINIPDYSLNQYIKIYSTEKIKQFSIYLNDEVLFY